MYAGEMVERAAVTDIYLQPHHPYTQGLLRCVPRLGTDKTSSVLYPIPGRVPLAQRTGRPAASLRHAATIHATGVPPGTARATRSRAEHWVRCHFAEEVVNQVLDLPENA